MAPLVKAPNAELLVSHFLRVTEELDSLVGDNIFTELPAGFKDWPAVRVQRVGGPTDRLAVIDHPTLQVDVWGGPKATACDVAETIRAALAQRLPWTLEGRGTLGSVERFGFLRYIPDDTYDPARPRYIFDVQLTTRR